MLQFNRPYLMKQHDEGEEGGGRTGGGQGKIEFTDFTGITGAPLRDDLLPPDEIRRLLVVAANSHKELVKKEKTKRDTIKALKEDRMSLNDYRQQMGATNQYKANPILANKVQFSGMSPEVTSIPTESNTNTNDENKNELTNEYRLTHQLRYEAQPKFNPQPKPY